MYIYMYLLQKIRPGIIKKINEETYQFVSKYNIKDKIKKIEQKPVFISIKDHKKVFSNNLNSRV